MATPYKDLKYADFMALMERRDREEVIKTEHKQVISEKISGTFEASKNNSCLNRFGHCVCFDHSRVVLPNEKNRGTYINANYVNGFAYKNKFICGEAPTQRTSYDFYRMIWMEHVQVIVMLCRKIEGGKEKCFPYWSEEEQSSLNFQKFKVTTTKIERFPHYVKTTLLLTDGTDASQIVTHYNYMAWPDHGLPSDISQFLDFVLEVKRNDKHLYEESLKNGHNRSQPPPIVVHCNAGLGRTPCYCTVDITISKFNSTQNISIPSIVSHIREQRFHCLFNPSQYYFCYEAIKVYLDSIKVKDVTKTSSIQKAVSFIKNLAK